MILQLLGEMHLSRLLLVTMIFAALLDPCVPASGDHPFVLILIPNEQSHKREIIRRTWLNISDFETSDLVAVRFLVDTKPPPSESNETDLIETLPQYKYNPPGLHGFIFAKMRTVFHVARSMSFTYVLWCDDDTVLNLRWFVHHLRGLKVTSSKHHKTNATRLYLGYPLHGSLNHPNWDPEYFKRLHLRTYPTYMHGSAVVFGNALFNSFGVMDEEVGLHFYGFGDVSFGVWVSGLDAEYKSYPEAASVFFSPKDEPADPSICFKYILVHNIKDPVDLENFGMIMKQCRHDRVYDPNLT